MPTARFSGRLGRGRVVLGAYPLKFNTKMACTDALNPELENLMTMHTSKRKLSRQVKT